MRNLFLTVVILVTVGFACSDDTVPSEPTEDVGAETGRDRGVRSDRGTTQDGGTEDVVPDQGTDVGVDTGSDVSEELTEDTGTDLGEDNGADTAEDTSTDHDAGGSYVLTLAVSDFSTDAPLVGVQGELLDSSGSALTPPITAVSDGSGAMAFELDSDPGYFWAKLELVGYLDHYVYEHHRLGEDFGGRTWHWVFQLLSPDDRDAMADALGLTADLSRGHLVGSLQWLQDETATNGWTDPIGCGTANGGANQIVYMGADGAPSLRSSTHPDVGTVISPNVPTGSHTFSATVGVETVHATFAVFANSITFATFDFKESDGHTSNPTPFDCN